MLRLAGQSIPVVGRARIYVCGITPYATTHLGHAATFLWADLAARVWQAQGVDTVVCRNITDIDDDMLREAARRGEDWRALAARQTYRFEDDMRALGVAAPTFEPLAHNYVDEVVELATALLERGHAYERDGTVWFRGAAVPERAGLGREEAAAALREHGGHAPTLEPEDELDVPVWQRSLEGEPAWPSPWGGGRPGWHAECAAMALSTLGPGLDLHGGGADLAFPHHAYEAALAEAAVGVGPFARAWLRPGTVRIAGEKMAKSTGNLVMVHDLIESWSPAAIRLLVFGRPWADAWDFDEQDLAAAEDRMEELKHWGGTDQRDEAAEQAALAALADDLDVSRALAIAADARGETLHRVGTLIGLF